MPDFLTRVKLTGSGVVLFARFLRAIFFVERTNFCISEFRIRITPIC